MTITAQYTTGGIVSRNVWTGDPWLSKPAPDPTIRAFVNGREYLLPAKSAAAFKRGLKSLKAQGVCV